MQVVPDTSVVVDGRVSERVADGTLRGATVVVPEAVVGELEAQANDGRETGWDGLAELQALADLAADGDIELRYVGDRPDEGQIRGAAAGDVDALIRGVAAEHDALFLTSDPVQSEVAKAKGIEVEYVEPRTVDTDRLDIEEFFDESTMSVHLAAGVRPMAKRGDVGEMRYEPIREEPLTEAELRSLAADVHEGARRSPDGFVELDGEGMTIVQFREYRIAVAEPPFSDVHEITAVRPLVRTTLEDYEHADALKERFLERKRGVLIAGSPGAGKSTFAGAVAAFLAENDNAVKTMEKPRDLQVDPGVTQYTALEDSMAQTADALLMVRPDYTIYDEVRKTDDFEVFADMRLAGVGMVGVVHATRGIDALQRLVGRVELGLIPQVVDTVVYIEDGRVADVYEVAIEVKVPHGLTEEDLARPVITVREFDSGRAVYEIYTFNRQVVTVPIEGDAEEASGIEGLAAGEIEREIAGLARGEVDVEVRGPNAATVYVPEEDISYVIGEGGDRITDVENRLGVDIDVRTHAERPDSDTAGTAAGTTGSATGSAGHAGERVTPELTGQHIVIPVSDAGAGDTVEIRADGEYLFTATVGRDGEIQVSRGSAIAEELERAVDRGQPITAV